MGQAAKRLEEENEPAAVYMRLDELHGWDKNPRVNDHAVADVADSIERFGFGNPILARRANLEVIAGHTRMKAARKLKLERVPVRLLDLSEHEAHLLALADNKLAEKADWDVKQLHALLVELDQTDMEMAGFSSEELAKLAQELAPDFSPIDEEEQSRLDELSPHMVTCPECGHEFNSRDAKREAARDDDGHFGKKA